MHAKTFETPVALFIFNRPGTTRRVFQSIAAARPARLFLTADGPRSGKIGDEQLCREVREIVARVDWPCEIYRNFSEVNLGCQERMISGLNWVFSLVDEAIILEDDCLPDPSFFPFCQELLLRYRGDDRVGYISGANLVEKYSNINDSYFFSEIGGIWGWATWRSEWQRYDRYLTDWPKLRQDNILWEVFGEPKAVRYWTRIFDDMYENKGPNTWDYQWLYSCLRNHCLTAVSRVNLITNIGFGADATHTTELDLRCVLPTTPMTFPLKHPASFVPLRRLDILRVRDMLPRSILHRVSTKIRRAVRGLAR